MDGYNRINSNCFVGTNRYSNHSPSLSAISKPANLPYEQKNTYQSRTSIKQTDQITGQQVISVLTGNEGCSSSADIRADKSIRIFFISENLFSLLTGVLIEFLTQQKEILRCNVELLKLVTDNAGEMMRSNAYLQQVVDYMMYGLVTGPSNDYYDGDMFDVLMLDDRNVRDMLADRIKTSTGRKWSCTTKINYIRMARDEDDSDRKTFDAIRRLISRVAPGPGRLVSEINGLEVSYRNWLTGLHASYTEGKARFHFDYREIICLPGRSCFNWDCFMGSQ